MLSYHSIWEFPTIGGPNMDPKIVGLLLYGLPNRGPEFLEAPLLMAAGSRDGNLDSKITRVR